MVIRNFGGWKSRNFVWKGEMGKIFHGVWKIFRNGGIWNMRKCIIASEGNGRPWSTPHRITQEELKWLGSWFGLIQEQGRILLLGSRLQQWNLLEGDVTITSYRKLHQHLEPFFRKESNLVFCSDIEGLMNALKSLGVLWLHNGNHLPSIPVVHAVHMKETYDKLK